MRSVTNRVLLIEDDEDDYLLTQDVIDDIADGSYEVVWCQSFESGLEKLKQAAFDICLVDYRIGADTGVDLIAAANANGLNTPMILLTGLIERDIELAATEVGAADYLEKQALTPALLERSIRFARAQAEARRSLTQQSNLLQATLENTGTGIAALDASGGLIACNNRFEKIMVDTGGAGPGANCGGETPIGEIDVPAALRAILDKHGGSQKDPPELRSSEGRTMQLRVNEMPDGGCVVVAIDVTEHKNVEQAYQSLKETQERLVQSEKMAALGELVAGIAHEVNTPVGVTLTGATQLQKETDRIRQLYDTEDLSAEDLEDFMNVAVEIASLMTANCQRAAELIQSFKQVAVDQAGGERRSFDLANYIGELLVSLRPLIKSRQCQILVDSQPGVVVDGYPGALSQLLTNLITNSLTHAYEETDRGTIKIAARPLGTKNIEIRYADDGKGIPPENVDRIFDPFFTTRRGSGGSGLGLSIAYNIASQGLKGTLTCKSKLGRGTAFVLRFPRIHPLAVNEGRFRQSGRGPA